MRGGAMNDTLFGGAGDDVVHGGGGRDLVRLGNGDDVFFDGDQSGNRGRDRVYGGKGADTLHAGGGDDRFSGGAGADLFAFHASGWDSDTILDFEDGLDRIQMTRPVGASGFDDLTIEDRSGDAAIFWAGAPGDVILLRSVAASLITAEDFVFV